MIRFVAIDFETADKGADSACALGAALVEGEAIVDTRYSLIRPPRPDIRFTAIHGIRWSDVVGQPSFAEAWPGFADLFEDVDFIAAHNAPFDRRVLYACCDAAAIARPAAAFRCSVKMARGILAIRPATLSNVCRRLGIALDHHHALSDAKACAEIVIAAQAQELQAA